MTQRWTIERLAASRRARIVAGVAALYFVATWLARASGAAVGAEVRLAPGIVLVLGLLYGPVVAWGAAVGHLVTDLLGGTFDAATGVGFLAQFVLAVAGYRLWGTFGAASGGERPGARSVGNLAEFALVALTAATMVGALTAWGAVLTGSGPFQATLLDAVPGDLVSTLFVGGAILYVLPAVGERLWPDGVRPLRRAATASDEPSSATGRGVLAVALAWCVVGVGTTVVFQGAELTGEHVLINRLGRTPAWLLGAAGPGGHYLQVAAGLVFLAASLALLFGVRVDARVVDTLAAVRRNGWS